MPNENNTIELSEKIMECWKKRQETIKKIIGLKLLEKRERLEEKGEKIIDNSERMKVRGNQLEREGNIILFEKHKEIGKSIWEKGDKLRIKSALTKKVGEDYLYRSNKIWNRLMALIDEADILFEKEVESEYGNNIEVIWDDMGFYVSSPSKIVYRTAFTTCYLSEKRIEEDQYKSSKDLT